MTGYLIVGTYVPRQCGIATFSKDLRDGLYGEKKKVFVAAITDWGRSYVYPSEVAFRVRQERQADYLACASWANGMPDIGLVFIQHEYGIFGGQDGEYVLDLASHLHKPYMVTTHTVLPQPSESQKRILSRLAGGAAGVICMTERARGLLRDVYQVSPKKIFVVPHGVPRFKVKDREELKRRHGLEERTVITTFGLIGPGKGLENGIKALARLIPEHPQLLYVIAGETHPMLLRREGERYREGIVRLVNELGLEDHVLFVNKFLDTEELGDYLYMTDVYLSPYPNMNQAVSGTLSFAVGCGRAIVSTPYEHARELLSNGRGLLARDASPEAIAEKLDIVLRDPEIKYELEQNAAEYGRIITWDNVARMYIRAATEVLAADAR